MKKQKHWMISSLLILIALCCGSTYGALAQDIVTEMHVFFKYEDSGTLFYTKLPDTEDGWLYPGGQATSDKNHGNMKGASLYIKNTVEMSATEGVDYILSVNKNHRTLDNTLFVCAFFNSSTQRNSFISNNRPWKELEKYGGSLAELYPVTAPIIGIDEQNYDFQSIYITRGGGTESRYYVIEEFDYVASAPSAKPSLKYETVVKVGDGSTPVYTTEESLSLGDENIVEVEYYNPAPYPILIHACRPLIRYLVTVALTDTKTKTTTVDYQPTNGPLPDSPYSVGGGGFWGYLDDNVYTGQYVLLQIPPGETAKLAWDFNMNYPSFTTGVNTSYSIFAPVVNRSAAASKVYEKYPLNLSEAEPDNRLNGMLPGNPEMLGFWGAFPNEVPASGPKNIYILVEPTKFFSKIQIFNENGKQMGNDITSLPAADDVGYRINLNNILDSEPLGNYYMKITGTIGETYHHNFVVDKNVKAINPDDITTQLVVVQQPGNSLYVGKYEPASSGSSKTLMKITGFMEKKTDDETTVMYEIGANALINGVLQLRNDQTTTSAASTVARLTWDKNEGTIYFETLSNYNGTVVTNLYANREKVFTSSSGNQITISFDGKTAYKNSYTDTGNPIQIAGGVRLAQIGLGDVRISDVGTPTLYLDGFSLNGQAQADCFIPNSMLDAKLNVEEALFGEYGFMGARGSLTDATLGINLFEQKGFQAQANVSFDMLPKSLDRHFKINGKLNLYGLFEADGGIGFRPIDDRYYLQGHTSDLPFDIWTVSDFSAKYNGTIGVCDLLLGFDIKNLHSHTSTNYLANPPSIELRGSFGVGKGNFWISGTAVLGATQIGITDGKLKLFVDLLEEVEGKYSLGGINYNNKTIPWFEMYAKGNLNVYGILTGSAGAKVRLDLSKSSRGMDHVVDMMNNVDGASAIEIGNLIYDALDVQYWGDISLGIPDGFPFAGLRVSGAINGNKDYIRAEANFKADINVFSLNASIDAFAWVQFKYSSPQGFSAGAELRSYQDVVPGTPLYGYTYTVPQPSRLRSTDTGYNGPVTFTSNILPVQKSNPGATLRAFDDEYAATATEPLATDHDNIILQVRSKSDQTGLTMHSPVINTAAPGTYIAQYFKASELGWRQALDGDGQPVDYYETSIPLKKNQGANMDYRGDWTMVAMNATDSIVDPNGLIQLQLYIVEKTESLELIGTDGSGSNGSVIFKTADLDPDATYRVLFSLVSDTVDYKYVYSLGSASNTDIGTGAHFFFPYFDYNPDFNTLNGTYFVQASLEKFVGKVQEEGSTEEFDSYERITTVVKPNVTKTYKNQRDPGHFYNPKAEAIGSGMAEVTWRLNYGEGSPNRDGHFVTFTDSDGISTEFKVDGKDTDKFLIRAGKHGAEVTDSAFVSIETDKKYAVSIMAYHEIDSVTYVRGVEMADGDSLLVPDPVFYALNTEADKFYVTKATEKTVPVYQGVIPEGNPSAVSGTVIYAQSDETLTFSASTQNSSAGVPGLVMRQSTDGVNFTPLTFNPTSNGFELKTNTTNFPDNDTTYLVQSLFYHQKDTTVYEFQMVIDNTPPLLMITRIERDSTEQGVTLILSGAVDAGSDLYLNGEDITSTLTAKGFSLDVTTTPSLSFTAIDKAGNISTGAYVIDNDFFNGTDDTKSVKLLTYGGLNVFKADTAGKIVIPVKARLIDQDDNWKEINGDDLIDWSIYYDNLAMVTKETDSTGVVTASKAIGSSPSVVGVMVQYRQLLSDLAPINILPYDAFLNWTMSRTTGTNSVGVSFGSLVNPLEIETWGEPFRSSRLRATDWKTMQYSCDQEDWLDVPDGAITWYTDSAAIDLATASISPCVNGVLYFRLNVLEGPSQGFSHTSAIIVGDLPDGVSHAKYVAYTAEGIASFVDTVAFMTPLTAPATPVRAGDTFEGWFTDTSFTNAWDFSDLVTDHMTLYGKWKFGPYTEPVSVEDIEKAPLQATTTEGGILVSGLTIGEPMAIYTITGQLLYYGKTTTTRQLIQLHQRGVYIIVHNGSALKAVY